MIPIQHRESDATPPLLAHFLIVASALAGCTAAPLFAPDASLIAPGTQTIATDGRAAFSDLPLQVYATDLDGDGDVDVLELRSIAGALRAIVRYDNLGGGSFGSPQLIAANTSDAECGYFFAIDLDGDGDPDVLTEARDAIAWYENKGRGVFGDRQVITRREGLLPALPASVYAADLDGDGDADVLSGDWSGSQRDRRQGLPGELAWYENQGGGVFGSKQVIKDDLLGTADVYATDLDGDGDADVLAAHWRDLPQDSERALACKICWYENKGGGVFGSQQVITTDTRRASSWVYATDLDGDGDVDVLAAHWKGLPQDSARDPAWEVSWYENKGGGAFGNPQVIAPDASGLGTEDLQAIDLDGDGDVDVLSASSDDKEVAWYENQGSGAFSNRQTISTDVGRCALYAADMDGDGDVDVLAAARDKVAWHENRRNKQRAGRELRP